MIFFQSAVDHTPFAHILFVIREEERELRPMERKGVMSADDIVRIVVRIVLGEQTGGHIHRDDSVCLAVEIVYHVFHISLYGHFQLGSEESVYHDVVFGKTRWTEGRAELHEVTSTLLELGFIDCNLFA